MAKLIKYILTESELQRLTGGQWPERLVKDYIASTVNEETINGEVGDLTVEITTIKGDIITINGQITSLSTRVTTAEGNITTLQTNLASHVGAQSAHGATGDIVGTNDYCTATVGGTVLLAAAQANAVASAVTPPAALGAASATYVQAEQQAQSDAVNALIANINTLKSDLNAAITVINNMLATERTAKQRAL